MSKAIIGAALIAGAIILDAVALATTGGIAAFFQPVFWALLSSGISMEASAIASALTANRGMDITTRQAAGLRQIVYGQQRCGGTIVYESTTGAGGSGGNYVYNFVIAVASHQIDAYINMFLDGRQVFWKQTANPDGFHANIGCGAIPNNSPVSEPPTTSVTVSSGVITGITASGGYGFANVQPVDGYRVRIYDPTGAGSGAEAWATLSGGSFGSSVGPNLGSAVGGTWTVTVENGGTDYSASTVAEIQGYYTFGGTGAADQQDPSQAGYGIGYGIGPGGPHYDFSGKVFCEVRFGDQPSGDYMESLSANDSSWPSSANGGGLAYIYLNVGYDTTQFPALPEVKLTINGKNDIYDPRDGSIGFSQNWALQVADVITSPVQFFGLADDSVNQDQLIAAANVCDEQIETSQGYESNYQQNIHYDAGTSPGDALQLMMATAAGRLSRIGAEWFIWPAYWQGPSLTFDQSYVIDAIDWDANRSQRDLVNRVNGTYVAPNYPYGVVGNLYDSNGFWYGETANLWPFAWQPTNFPQYAQDTLHGYESDANLAADDGIPLPQELNLRGVISIVQAQRVAKINLTRNRQQGSGVFPMNLAAYQLQPLDVMNFSFPPLGWGATTIPPTPPPGYTPPSGYVTWAYPSAAPTNGDPGFYASIGASETVGPVVFNGFAIPGPGLPVGATITEIIPVAIVGISTSGSAAYEAGGTNITFPSTSDGFSGTYSGTSLGTSASDISLGYFSFEISTSPFGDNSASLEVSFLGLAVAFTLPEGLPLPTYYSNDQALEVTKIVPVIDNPKDEAGEDKALTITCQVSAQMTAESIYEWSESEELTPYEVPAGMAQISYAPIAPTSLSLSSASATNSGIVTPGLQVSWTAPADNSVAYINVQYKAHSSGTWISTGLVSADTTSRTIVGVVAGTAYDVRIASVRYKGQLSSYVEADNFTVTASASGIDGSQIVSGTVPPSYLPVATSSTLGIVQPDNHTISISSGVISADTHSESLTDDNGNFIFDASLTEGGDIITVVEVPN